MIKTLVLNGEVNDEMVEKTVVFYNGLAEGDEANVMLSSVGGYLDAKDAILSLLNLYSKVTMLTAYHRISSSAFLLFFNYQGKKALAENCTGMAHRASVEVSLDSRGVITSAEAKFSTDELKTVLWGKEFALYNKIGVPSGSLNLLSKGKSVYFTFEQMKTFLKNSTPPF